MRPRGGRLLVYVQIRPAADSVWSGKWLLHFRSLIKDWKKKNVLWHVKITFNFNSTDKVSSEHSHTHVLSVAAFALNWQSGGVIITEIHGPKARSICHLALCTKSVLTPYTITKIVANVNNFFPLTWPYSFSSPNL